MGLYVRWFISAVFLAVIFYLTPNVAFGNLVSLAATVLALGLINSSIKKLLANASVPTSLPFVALAALLGNGALLWLASAAGWIRIDNYPGASYGLIAYWAIVLIVSMGDNDKAKSKTTRKKSKK